MRLQVERQTASPPSPASARASSAAALAVERDALAQLDRRAVVRDADEDEAHVMRSGSAGGRADGDDEREAGEREVRGAAAAPAARSGAAR